MSNEMSNLLNQAKSEARLERLLKFFGKNAKLVTYAAGVVLLAGILFFIFTVYQKKAQTKYSAMLHQSLIYQQIGEGEKARAELKKIVDAKSAPSGVKSLASLRYAAFLMDERKIEEVKKIYSEVNKCSSCDDYIQDLAGLLLVRVMISDESEVAKSDELVEKISKIEDRATVLKGQIAEQHALFELLRNNLEKSYEIFKKIAADESASQLLKARANDGMKMAIAKGFHPSK
jgi:hypothetical protein